MLIKSFIITLTLCLGVYFAQSQENKLLISFKDSTSKVVKKGDYVRLSYPSAKLSIKKSARMQELLGVRGKVDSVGENQIWLKIDKRTGKKQAFNIDDIVAIKRVSKSAELLAFLGTSIVVGGGAVLATNSMDLNSGAVAFAGVFSLFPSAIITANVFYPTKPRHKVGEDYTIKVITIN
ncbi:MAG TPA: hypothetical protein VL125_16870 [Pelobium sp.]|nr:hypothetical protein [Pelobium sp.]